MNIGERHTVKLMALSAILIILIISNAVAKPVQQQLREQKIRDKRSGISDQRLAELETLLELKKLRESSRTRMPIVAYGVIDPDKIGRRRKRERRFRSYGTYEDYNNNNKNSLSDETRRTNPPFILETIDY